MNIDFNQQSWHDAKLFDIEIDRTNPGNNDHIKIKVKWPNGIINKVIFKDCYYFEAKMNFGIIADESILHAECSNEDEIIHKLIFKWQPLGVNLHGITKYQITTNSTNSRIIIFALSCEFQLPKLMNYKQSLFQNSEQG